MYRFQSFTQAQQQGRQLSFLPAVSLVASLLGAAWISYRAWDFVFHTLIAIKAALNIAGN